jgi:hypothetical protein
VEAVAPALLAIRGLVEPLGVRGLLAGAGRVHEPQGPEERYGPRVDRVAALSILHSRPLLVHDRARVADDLPRQAIAHTIRQKLCGLELLHHGERFGFPATARLVVALKGEKDDEAGEDRKTTRQHAEHPRSAIAVLEAAALRRPAPDQQHRRDSRDVDGQENDDAPEKTHCP